MDVKELIRALGGPAAVARALGVRPSRITNWYAGLPQA